MYFLSFAPSGVIRLSPATETDDPEWFTVIDRNLYMVNNRPLRPTRRCLKITGPPILIRIKTATTNNTEDKANKPNSDAVRSKRYFNMPLNIYQNQWKSHVNRLAVRSAAVSYNRRIPVLNIGDNVQEQATSYPRTGHHKVSHTQPY